MTDPSKIKETHTQRAAFIYLRQSTPAQVEHNRESTARQYALADKACQLGWSKEQVVIIDEDLGLSGSSTDKRSGFTRMTSEVALAHVGIILGLEVSRLARNNADWYRLLELCGITDTLIGDNDGVFGRQHKGDAAFDLLLDSFRGSEGRMSGHGARVAEAKVHVAMAVDIVEVRALGLTDNGWKSSGPLHHPVHGDAREQRLLAALIDGFRFRVVGDEALLFALHEGL